MVAPALEIDAEQCNKKGGDPALFAPPLAGAGSILRSLFGLTPDPRGAELLSRVGAACSPESRQGNVIPNSSH